MLNFSSINTKVFEKNMSASKQKFMSSLCFDGKGDFYNFDVDVVLEDPEKIVFSTGYNDNENYTSTFVMHLEDLKSLAMFLLKKYAESSDIINQNLVLDEKIKSIINKIIIDETKLSKIKCVISTEVINLQLTENKDDLNSLFYCVLDVIPYDSNGEQYDDLSFRVYGSIYSVICDMIKTFTSNDIINFKCSKDLKPLKEYILTQFPNHIIDSLFYPYIQYMNDQIKEYNEDLNMLYILKKIKSIFDFQFLDYTEEGIEINLELLILKAIENMKKENEEAMMRLDEFLTKQRKISKENAIKPTPIQKMSDDDIEEIAKDFLTKTLGAKND